MDIFLSNSTLGLAENILIGRRIFDESKRWWVIKGLTFFGHEGIRGMLFQNMFKHASISTLTSISSCTALAIDSGVKILKAAITLNFMYSLVIIGVNFIFDILYPIQNPILSDILGRQWQGPLLHIHLSSNISVKVSLPLHMSLFRLASHKAKSTPDNGCFCSWFMGSDDGIANVVHLDVL